MEKLLESAAIAWNPIGEVRRRMQLGTLSAGTVLVPFIGIVISCNLLAGAAQEFFFGALLLQAGGQMPDHLLLTSDFGQRFMSAIGVLVPLGAVAVLPARVFHPPGRSATVAAMLVVAAAWAFYGAAIGIPVYFVAGALATVDLELGWTAFVLLSIPSNLVIFGLTLFFWFRVTLSVLRLSGTRVTGISLVAAVAEAPVVWFILFVAQGSP